MVSRFLISLLLSTVAHANVVGTGNQNFNPETSGIDYVTVQSTETLKPGIINLGLFVNDAANSLPYFQGNNQSYTKINDHLIGVDLNMGVGLLPNWEVGFSLPFIAAQSVDSDQFHGQFTATGNTEIRPMTKYHFWGNATDGLAVIFSVDFNRTIDNPYIGDGGGPLYNYELAWDHKFGKNNVAVNFGYRKASPGTAIAGWPITPMGDQYIASAGYSRTLEKVDTKLIAEVFGSWPAQKVGGDPDRVNTSAEALVGVKYDYTHNVAVQVGGGTELQEGYSSPTYRVYGGLNYTFGPAWKSSTSIHQESDDKFSLVNVVFDFDSDKIALESIPALEEAILRLKKYGDYKQLVISGHTDSVGKREYNLRLSERRAEAVKTFLIQQGFDAKRIVIKGKGPDEPMADNGNYQGRQLNRRVEFEVVK